MAKLKLVPELYCENIEETKWFYVEVFGFQIKYERLEEPFIYFTLDDVDLMVEGINGVGRRWLTGSMESPLVEVLIFNGTSLISILCMKELND
jgi:catechol 2,3-dioxygenase-like lactoylglutathione lyase family enzyme